MDGCVSSPGSSMPKMWVNDPLTTIADLVPVPVDPAFLSEISWISVAIRRFTRFLRPTKRPEVELTLDLPVSKPILRACRDPSANKVGTAALRRSYLL